MTAHHSGPNRSARRRCSLILRYVPVSAWGSVWGYDVEQAGYRIQSYTIPL